MENNKSIWKRIAAILTSAFLIFSRTSADVIANSNKLKEMPIAVTNELNIEDRQNILEVSRAYSDFREIAEDIIPLEVVKSTSVGGDICDTMVPQGLEIIDDMLLVTAYDGINGYRRELGLYSYKKENRDKLENQKNHQEHNSVIYVFDKNSKELIVTIELSDKNHVGGIAADDKNVYIAKSTDEKVSVIQIRKIREAVEDAKQRGVKTVRLGYDREIDCNCDASFITIRKNEENENQFVIGTWNPLPYSSQIRIFNMDNDGNLILDEKFNVNSSANGGTFVKKRWKRISNYSIFYRKIFRFKIICL